MHELSECLRHPGLGASIIIATSVSCSIPTRSAESQPNRGSPSPVPNARLNMAVGQTRARGGRDPGAASRGDLAPGYVEHGLRPNETRQRR